MVDVSGKPTIISFNGASSDYPDCTDLAYNQAVLDGADFIDCPVQMTKDGVPICMSSIDLIHSTTVTTSAFRESISILPELQTTAGIFVFNFTWEEIQTLKRKPNFLLNLLQITLKKLNNPINLTFTLNSTFYFKS